MSRDTLGYFSFSAAFTQRFAALSGDYNPLHLDPERARRYAFGSTIVHGMALLFQSLEFYFDSLGTLARLQAINVRFINPVRHDDEIEYRHESNDTEATLEAFLDRRKVFQAKLTFARCASHDTLAERQAEGPESCTPLDIDEAGNLESRVSLSWNPDLCRELFPKLHEYLPPQQLVSLLGFTRIVGMHCPGLNSLFIGFSADFVDTETVFEPFLDYEVSRVDKRFSLLNLTLRNAITKGRIDAVFRPQLVTQQSYEEIRKVVTDNEFSGQTALVIGGSRGLGEIVVKIICAGGGRCYLTYASGKEDAERLTREIEAAGGRCTPLRFDVLEDEFSIGEFVAEKQVSHLYYFASPRIEKSKSPILDHRLLELYLNFYVTAFCRILGDCRKKLGDDRRAFSAFVPSSVFLDEPPPDFSEYCIAKSAAEDCCRYLQQGTSEWKLLAVRLPMLLTDQTSGVAGLSGEKSVPVLLDQIRLIR